MSDIELSIVILSYNTKELLRQCLKSIERETRLCLGASAGQGERVGEQELEIIIVDNKSTDGSVEMLREWKSRRAGEWKIKLIENSRNVGFAGGNNVGLKEAKGKYVLFLNSDTEIYPNALKKALNFMKSDEKIGAMTPKTMLFSGKMDPDCHRGFPTPWASLTYFLGLEKLFPKSKIFGQYHKFYENLNETHEIDAGFGTFLIIRREVYEKIGGWDEQYFFYGEDLDYFYRIKHADWKVMFYPEPLLRHHKGGSSGLRKESKEVSPASRETRIKTAKASIKAMEIFYQKFYQDKYPAWVTFLVLLTIKIKGFFRILKHYLK